MNGKKGKDIATNMILDDLLDDDEEAVDSLHQVEDSGKDHVGQEDQDSLGGEILQEDPSLPFLNSSEKEDSSEVDHTLRLNQSKALSAQTGVTQLGTSANSVRQSVGRFAPVRSAGGVGPTEASLAQSENLRIAQQRILDLEKEIERFRSENEKLVTAGETIRKKADELLAKNEAMESKYNLDVSSLTEEKGLLKKSLVFKDNEIDKLKDQLEEMKLRLNTTLQKIRVRERELENRLELVKMESTALVHNKDEIILELKRQMDQVSLELDNYQHKGQELNKQLNAKQEIFNRTIKALRIALTMLEGTDSKASEKAK